MTAHELICEDGDRRFSVGNSKIVWDGLYVTSKQNYRAHRTVALTSASGLWLGDYYYSRPIRPDQKITLK